MNDFFDLKIFETSFSFNDQSIKVSISEILSFRIDESAFIIKIFNSDWSELFFRINKLVFIVEISSSDWLKLSHYAVYKIDILLSLMICRFIKKFVF